MYECRVCVRVGAENSSLFLCLCERVSSIAHRTNILIVHLALARSSQQAKWCQVWLTVNSMTAKNVANVQFCVHCPTNMSREMDESWSSHRNDEDKKTKEKSKEKSKENRQPKVSDYVVHIPKEIYQKQSNQTFAVGRFLGKVIRYIYIVCANLLVRMFIIFFCSVFFFLRRDHTQNVLKWRIRKMAINSRAKFSAKIFCTMRNYVNAFAPKSIFTVTSHTIISRNTFRNFVTITTCTWCWNCAHFDRSKNCNKPDAPSPKSNAVSLCTKYCVASVICINWKLSIVIWSCRMFFCRTIWVWKSVILVWPHE